jgi:hypothetical protein
MISRENLNILIMMKTLAKQSITAGYANRYKKIIAPLEPIKAQSNDANRSIKSPAKSKLPILSVEKHSSSPVSPQRTLFKHIAIMRPIEEKSNDYESAIKDHLGIRNLSRESRYSQPSPLAQRKIAAIVSKKQGKSLDTSANDYQASIETQENQLNNSLKNPIRKTNRARIPNSLSNTNKEDKEIQLIQDSLNKINVLLGKLLNKSPMRSK